MKTKRLHNWDMDYAAARRIQAELAAKLRFEKLLRKPELVAGLDCAFSKNLEKICAVVVVLKLPEFDLVEMQSAVREVRFPYIPGLLSFREGPVCIEAASKLRSDPDVFIVDGQGIAHPRRLGLASHLGLFFDKPTVGCAKSRLIGTFEEVGSEKGNYSWLTDKGQRIGAVLRTRSNVKPVFVSVGNRCVLKDAIRTVLDCAVKYRLPEPTRIAHKEVTKLKADI